MSFAAPKRKRSNAPQTSRGTIADNFNVHLIHNSSISGFVNERSNYILLHLAIRIPNEWLCSSLRTRPILWCRHRFQSVASSGQSILHWRSIISRWAPTRPDQARLEDDWELKFFLEAKHGVEEVSIVV
jgi:hypothetical protein